METINYPTGTPDVTFTYDQAGNRKTMTDGTGVTTYSYDDLYRLTGVNDGAGLQVGYGYDAVGNRTRLTYPNNYTATYTYDPGNRLDTVIDWNNGQFGYNYDDANRLVGLTLPNNVSSSYSYDSAGRLELLAHNTLTETIASYDYALDQVGNRRVLTETIAAMQEIPGGVFLEEDGRIVVQAEHFTERTNGPTHQWNLKTTQSGYTGTSYLQPLPDIDALYQTDVLTDSPVVVYPLDFTLPGTYTLWLRGYAGNASGDSAYIGLNNQVVDITGFAPNAWTWANTETGGQPATVAVTNTGVYTLELLMREDGLRIDRLLLTTDTTYIPTGFGPPESDRLTDTTTIDLTIDRVITYSYDDLYHLTGASYSTGEMYSYEYDPVGNRLQQIIDGNTTEYLYDAANRLWQASHQSTVVNYQFDANGNMLNTDTMTNTWDAANRLTQSQQGGTALEPIYNGVNDRVAQTKGLTTTYFALDSTSGLPEVIYTDEGNAYLHLPGVIMAESSMGEIRYLLSDGLGSIRQAVDENAELIAYHEYDPYGNPISNLQSPTSPYGYTGEWWEAEVGLLHLRARWYQPETGRFLNRDPLFNMAQYGYASGNPINRVDPSGLVDWNSCVKQSNVATCHLEFNDSIWGIAREVMAFHGVPDPYSNKPEVINRILNQMEPRMWDLNPHLRAPGLSSPPHPSTPEHLGWHCPACPQYNSTSSPAIPYGTINVPASWLPFAVTNPHQPDETDSDPYFPPPIIKPDPPAPQGPPPPGGISEIAQAIFESHVQQEDDGIIFGGSFSTNYIPQHLGFDIPNVTPNGECLPGTGVIGGIEIVYDFKHQERGIFSYDGPNLNFGSVANASIAPYIGKTRGFKNQSYQDGVTSYEGYFASGTLSGNTLVVEGGVAIIEAAPLDKYQRLNRSGVFATYYGLSIGPGASLPVNVDIAVTNYSILFDGVFPGRVRYGVPGGGIGAETFFGQPLIGGFSLPDAVTYQKSIPNRIVAAKFMENEIRGFSGTQGIGQWLGYTNPFGIYINQAIDELWDFVYRPEVGQ
jgi:RHS repeat-associated protein